MKEISREWLRKAQDDLDVIEEIKNIARKMQINFLNLPY